MPANETTPGIVIAEETHASIFFAAVMALPAVTELVAAVLIPNTAARVALVIGGVLMLGGAALAASGFHYLFTRSGVEIRTLGLPLLLIPASSIQSYAVDRWSWRGGYGIRGLGSRRGYVWSNTGVRIRTAKSDIFLGHSDPERLIRDLDMIRQTSEGNAETRSF